MKVTIVTTYFAPEISPITHLYADLAADLTRLGAEVTVVTSVANRGLDQKTREAYSGRRDERTPEGYRILRTGPEKGEDLTSTIRRGLHLVNGTRALYRTARSIPTDVYLLGSMPPTLGFVGAKLGKKAPTVYILQDIFPDSILLMGMFSEKHPLIRLCRAMEHATYRGNTRFITISEDMRETLLARGIPKEKLDVVENWTDCNSVRPVPREENPLFDELGLSREGFYGVYAGALGVLQDPDVLLDAAACLKGTPDVTLLIFGDGNRKKHLLERAEKEHLDNVRFFPLLPEGRVSEVYSLGDAALIPLKKGATRIAVPSKTWTAMAAGRPIFFTAGKDSRWAETLRRERCGVCTPPGDGEALADAMLSSCMQPGELAKMGENSRAYVETARRREEATARYFEILQKGIHEYGNF